MTPFSTDNYVSFVGNLPAWVALTVSIVSAYFSRKSYLLSRQKEARALPNLLIYLSDAFSRRADGGMSFTFSIVLTNRSDTPNAISEVELIVKFVEQTGFELSRRLRPYHPTTEALLNPLSVGLRLNPWESKPCTCHFFLPDSPKGDLTRLPSPKLEMIDSTGTSYSVTAEILSERDL